MGEWVVLLEVAADSTGAVPTRRQVEALLGALNAGYVGGALHCPDRYAMQVRATGSGPLEALSDVLGRWAETVVQLDLPTGRVVRTEVLTPEELARDFEGAGWKETAPRQSGPLPPEDSGTELLRQALSDPLTGLLGREAFCHRLAAVLRAGTDSGATAVVWLDLDGFARINDRYGGAKGDAVILAVAQRLAARLRPGDTLARFGSDDYVFLLNQTTKRAARAVAARMIDTVALPVALDGEEVLLSCSAGIAVGHPGDDAQSVLRQAQAALGLAKAAGGGRHSVNGPDGPELTETGRDFRTAALQDRLAHLLLMQQAAVAANEAETLRSAAQRVIRQICAHIGCETGHLWVSPRVAEELVLSSLWLVPEGDADLGEAIDDLSVGAGLVGRVVATGRPAWISELAAEPPLVEVAARRGVHSAFAFPVLVGQEIVAVLELFSRARIEPTDSFLDVLSGIGTQLGRVVERQRAAAAMRHSQERLLAAERHLRQTEVLARISKELYSRIVETTHEGILIVDADNVTTTSVNARMAQILGYEVQEMAGMPVTRFVHEETFAALSGHRQRRRAGISESYETQLRAKGGAVMHVRISASPLSDEHGRYSGTLAMVTDITALREAEDIVRAGNGSAPASWGVTRPETRTRARDATREQDGVVPEPLFLREH